MYTALSNLESQLKKAQEDKKKLQNLIVYLSKKESLVKTLKERFHKTLSDIQMINSNFSANCTFDDGSYLGSYTFQDVGTYCAKSSTDVDELYNYLSSCLSETEKNLNNVNRTIDSIRSQISSLRIQIMNQELKNAK